MSLVQCFVNSVTLSGKSGASSGKAEDEGVAGSYVEDENAVKGVICLAGTHGYLRGTTLSFDLLPTAELGHCSSRALPYGGYGKFVELHWISY